MSVMVYRPGNKTIIKGVAVDYCFVNRTELGSYLNAGWVDSVTKLPAYDNGEDSPPKKSRGRPKKE